MLCIKTSHRSVRFSFWWHGCLCQMTLIIVRSFELLEIELIVDPSL